MSQAPSARASDRRLFLAVLAVAALLATPLAHQNENRTIDLLHAMSEGRLAIDAEHGNTGDKSYVPSPPSAAALELGLPTPPTQLRGGHYYMGGAPGLAWVLFPFYLAFRAVLPARLVELALTLVGAALPLALASVGVARAVRALADRAPSAPGDARALDALSLDAVSLDANGAATGLALALATTALSLGTRLFCHALAIGLFAWALALVLEGSRPWRYALAGLLAAVAVASDYNAWAQAVVLALLGLATGGIRGAVWLTLGTVPVVLGLGTYHQACFGSPLKTPYDYHWSGPIADIYGRGTYGFTYPRPWILLELLVGPRRGFLWCQPVALVGLAGLVREARRSRLLGLALAAVVLGFLTNASRAIDWDSGAAFGSRYLSQTLPFVALGIPAGLALLGRAARPVVAASGALAFAGATTAWGHSVFTNLDWLWLLGPRVVGLSVLLLGQSEDVVDARTILVAVLGLAAAVPVAWSAWCRARERRASPVALAGLALLPALVAAPALAAIGLGPRGTAEQRHKRLVIREGERAIAAVRDADEMRRLEWQIAMRARDDRAPELYLEALEKLVELAPDDAEARGKLERFRAQLSRPPR